MRPSRLHGKTYPFPLAFIRLTTNASIFDVTTMTKMDMKQETENGGHVQQRPWSVATAKARLSEVISRAKSDGPQLITKNGRPTAVVVDVAEWQRKTGRKGTLVEFFRDSPLYDSGIVIERRRDTARPADL